MKKVKKFILLLPLFLIGGILTIPKSIGFSKFMNFAHADSTNYCTLNPILCWGGGGQGSEGIGAEGEGCSDY